jgi:ASPIC and UnbV
MTITILEQGMERQICRTVTSGASFGGNSLVLEVALRKAGEIKEVKVQWPCKDCPEQIFKGINVNQSYELIQDKATPELIKYPVIKFKATHDHSKHKLP